MFTIHREGLAEDAYGRFRELIQVQFVFPGVDEIGDIATRMGFPGDTLTKVIDDHIVEARTFGRASASLLVINVDAIESLDHLQDPDLQTGLFQ